MKKPIYKRWWFWVIIAVLVIGIGSAGLSDDDSSKESGNNTTQSEAPKAEEKEPDKPDVPKEYKSALKKAESYSKHMHMSKQGIYDQLVSEYGEKFSEEAAQYAMDNLKADFKENALEKARAMVVFPTPGISSRRICPDLKIAIMIFSIASCLPITAFCTSWITW